MKSSPGFTLVEVMVVVVITIMITGFLITDFSRTQIDLNESALTSLDAVREAQTDALSGTVFHGAYRCGYGIHFDQTGYTIYVGPDSKTVTCSAQDRNYNAGVDEVVRRGVLSTSLEYVVPTSDIFFEPPNPTTYIAGVSTAGTSVDIVLRKKNAACGVTPTYCKTLHVTTSGQIQLQ